MNATLSPYGLLDVSGNAWEWIADWYDVGYYQRHSTNNPQSPETCSVEHNQERGVCQYKIIRGGGYNSQQDAVRTTARGFWNLSNSTTMLGFVVFMMIGLGTVDGLFRHFGNGLTLNSQNSNHIGIRSFVRGISLISLSIILYPKK